jgi:hypothetical protein
VGTVLGLLIAGTAWIVRDTAKKIAERDRQG